MPSQRRLVLLIKSIDLVLVALGTGGFCIYELILSSNPSAIDRLFKQIRLDEVNIGRLDKNSGRRKHLYFGSVRTLP